ncbi:MAG: exodeoxyribonuclease VII small subunit [Lachnospiraceae bacterium]|nr:exodeoxyribonuclease VII small subunit [Lachnospiraceae bacterium]
MKKSEMEKLTLEEAFEKVDERLEELSGDVALEKSFELYKEGMELLKICDEKLKKVEGRILIMNEEGEMNEFQ